MSEVFLGNFSPTSFPGCAMWLDGADQTAASMTLSGTSLTLWKDKSGSGNNATPYNTSYATVNSNGVLFASQIYTTPYTSAPSTETAFVVFNVTAATYTGFQAIIGSSVNGGRELALLNGSPLFGLLKAQIAWQNTSAFTPGATTLGEGFINGSTAFSGVNGTYTATNTVTWSAGGFLYIGTEVSVPNGNYVGLIKEILIYNVVLTTDQTTQVEGYLSWKWGIQTSLPSAHPYKSINNYISTGFPAAIQSLVNSPFTPLNVPGCALWLDGADSSSASMTLSGSSITAWKDKSGNGVSFTIGGTPTLSNAAYNGRSSVYFNGSTNFYNTTFNLNLINHSFFIVVTETSGGNAGVLIFHNISAGTYDFNATNGLEFDSPEFGVEGNYANQPYSNLTYGIYGDTATSSTSNLILYKNGTSVVTKTGLTAQTSTGLVIGSRVYPSNYMIYMTGYVSEVLVYSTALTNAQRQQVEGYLAWKWGIQASLPSLHPYANASPTIPVTIAIAPTPIAVTSGGTITTAGAYRIHTFKTTGSSTFTTNKIITAQVIVVGGGGGGGGDWGGGGGAGGALLTTVTLTTANSPYSLVVGTGGASGTSGVSSTFTANGTTYTGLGGGAGGTYSLGNGASGGCGGGAGAGYNGSSTGGSATQSGGNAGGAFTNGGTNVTGAAGGGGMGSAGVSSTSGGHGGNGITYTIAGTQYTFAGGGGAGSGTGASSFGLGKAGGGNGGMYVSGGGTPGIAALANTGSGGGGTSIGGGGNAGVGGSGIVMIAFIP